MSELNITRNDSGNHLSVKGRCQQPRYMIKQGNGLYVQSAAYKNFRSEERLNLNTIVFSFFFF
jgi:hypothetical protein